MVSYASGILIDGLEGEVLILIVVDDGLVHISKLISNF